MSETYRGKIFWHKMVQACPILPYLSLGVWQAWGYVAYGGSGWLSASEIDGSSMSAMYALSTLTFGLGCLAICLMHEKTRAVFMSRTAVVLSAIITALSGLLIVALGPFLLSQSLPDLVSEGLFVVASIATGLGTCIIGIKCGQLYGALKPREAIIYGCVSYLLMTALYFFIMGMPEWSPVEGSPSLAGALAFIILPPAAAMLLLLSFDNPREDGASIHLKRAFPLPFWKLMVVVLTFSFIIAALSTSLIETGSLNETIDGTCLGIALGVVFILALIGIAVGLDAEHFNFGRLYSLIMIAAVLVVALLPLMNASNTTSVMLSSFIVTSFGFLIWCLLSFISCQRKLSSVLVFSVGYGGFMLCSGVGGFFGSYVLPDIIHAGGETTMCFVFAAIVLVSAFFLFSEKEFDALFEYDDATVLSLSNLLGDAYPNDFRLDAKGTFSDTDKEETDHKKTFHNAVEVVAKRHGLSAREEDVLFYLAMGFSATAIAERLYISWNTVRVYSRNIYSKLDVHSKQELMDLIAAERKASDSEKGL